MAPHRLSFLQLGSDPTRILSLATLMVFLLMMSPLMCRPVLAQTADDHVAQGRAYLEAENLQDAHTSFESALALEPSHDLASFYHAATRILVLTYGTAANDLMDRSGVSTVGRDFYSWTADFQRDAVGDVIAPSDAPRSSEVIGFLKDTLLPEIDGALGDLSVLDSTFNHMLSAAEVSSTDPVEVDWGDVLFLRAVLNGLKAHILILDAYDLDVDMDVLWDEILAGTFSVNDSLLNVYANLAELNSSHELSDAKTALDAAIQAYLDASAFIRSETDPQEDDFIGIDAEDLGEEEELRNMLADVQTSLSGPVMVGDEELDEPDRLDLTQFFDDPFSLRSHLPQLENVHDMVTCTFPDPTFTGMLPDDDQDVWANRLHLPVEVTGTVSCAAFESGESIYVTADWGFTGTTNLTAPGVYSIEVDSGQTVEVTAWWDKDGDGRMSPGDYEGTYENNPFVVVSSGCSGPTGIDVDLANPVIGIKGQVTDQSGAPVPNAWVNAYSGTCWSWDWLGDSTTDENGEYVINGLSAVTTYLRFSASGYVDMWFDGEDGTLDCAQAAAVHPSAGDTVVDFVMDSGSSITGRVTDTSGVSLVGIWVEASGPTYEYDQTDSNGEYEIWGLEPGSYRLVAYGLHTIYSDEYYNDKPNWESADWVTVGDHSGVTGINFALEIDSDGDGLSDNMESLGCTSPYDADTDDDGILDGYEDTNHNGILDAGETDPCDVDTDDDGIQDGTERAYTENHIGSDTDTQVFQPDLDPSTWTNPIESDTDGDGVPDGVEDPNHNGRVDPGESSPLPGPSVNSVDLRNVCNDATMRVVWPLVYSSPFSDGTAYLVTNDPWFGGWTPTGTTIFRISNIWTNVPGTEMLAQPFTGLGGNGLTGTTPIGSPQLLTGTTSTMILYVVSDHAVANMPSQGGATLYKIDGGTGAMMFVGVPYTGFKPGRDASPGNVLSHTLSGQTPWCVAPLTLDWDEATSAASIYGVSGIMDTGAGSGVSIWKRSSATLAPPDASGTTAFSPTSGVNAVYAAPVISGNSLFVIAHHTLGGSGISLFQFDKRNLMVGGDNNSGCALNSANIIEPGGMANPYTAQITPTPVVQSDGASGGTLYVVDWSGGLTLYDTQNLTRLYAYPFMKSTAGVTASPVASSDRLLIPWSSSVSCFATNPGSESGGFCSGVSLMWQCDFDEEMGVPDGRYQIWSTPSLSNGYAWVTVLDSFMGNSTIWRFDLNSTYRGDGVIVSTEPWIVGAPIIVGDHDDDAYVQNDFLWYCTYNPTVDRLEQSPWAEAEGFWPQIKFDPAGTAENTRPLLPDAVKGDLDGDGDVDTADASIALEVLAGNTPIGIRADYTSSGADVNGDGRIGMEEVLYIQEKINGLRVP